MAGSLAGQRQCGSADFLPAVLVQVQLKNPASNAIAVQGFSSALDVQFR